MGPAASEAVETSGISAGRVRSVLFLAMGLLLVAHLTFLIPRLALGLPRNWALGPTFHFDVEANVPTWFSVVLLLACALLLSLIAGDKHGRRDPFRHHWTALAILFAFFSLDELASFHEAASRLLREALDPTGFLYYIGAVAAVPVVVILGLLFRGFLLSLPRVHRRRFLLAGALYIGATVVLEIIEGGYAYRYGINNPTYEVMTTIEELLEMTGLIIFVHGLLAYMSETGREWRINVRP